MKGDKVSNLEPAKMLEPLFTILLAIIFSLFFQGIYESNIKSFNTITYSRIGTYTNSHKKRTFEFQ